MSDTPDIDFTKSAEFETAVQRAVEQVLELREQEEADAEEVSADDDHFDISYRDHSYSFYINPDITNAQFEAAYQSNEYLAKKLCLRVERDGEVIEAEDLPIIVSRNFMIGYTRFLAAWAKQVIS